MTADVISAPARARCQTVVNARELEHLPYGRFYHLQWRTVQRPCQNKVKVGERFCWKHCGKVGVKNA